MGVRVWGVVEDRLIELRFEPATSSVGFRIEGLPEGRTRTTADRVGAALVNSGVVRGTPPVVIRLEPAVQGRPTSDLDVALALAVLAGLGAIGVGLRWILATGRLGLDGTVHRRGLSEPTTLADVVESLCRTRMLDFEHMFENEEP